MGHWGWRPLLVTAFCSVWVAGCNLIGDSASSTAPVSRYPAVTLTAGRSADRASPAAPPAAITLAAVTPLALASQATLATGDQAGFREATPTPAPLQLDAPQCSELPGGGILCLGRVQNDLPSDVERVMVQVALLRGEGEAPLIENVAIEQNLIPTGGFAPYRAMFSAPWSTFLGATARLLSADLAQGSPYRSLPVSGLSVELSGRLATVTGVISNPYPEALALQRAIVTFIDPSGAVSVFRVIPLDDAPLAAGAAANLQVEVLLPNAPDDALPRASMAVEAVLR